MDWSTVLVHKHVCIILSFLNYYSKSESCYNLAYMCFACLPITYAHMLSYVNIVRVYMCVCVYICVLVLRPDDGAFSYRSCRKYLAIISSVWNPFFSPQKQNLPSGCRFIYKTLIVTVKTENKVLELALTNVKLW